MTKKPFLITKRDSTKIGILFLLLPAIASLIAFILEINFVNSLKKIAGPLPAYVVFLNILIVLILCLMLVCLYGWILAKQEKYRADREGIYVYTGIFFKKAVFKSWGEISTIQMGKDPLDMLLGLAGRHTGTIRIPYGGTSEELLLKDVLNCGDVYQTLVDCQNEVYRDIHFPNVMREGDGDE